MATTNKKVHFSYFERKQDFTPALQAELTNNIVFVEDTKEVYTHGEFFGIRGVTLNYDSSTAKLQLKDGGAVVSEMDASAFVKDGMLDSVELVKVQESGVSETAPYLKFVFNTDSGKTAVRVSVSTLVDTYDGSNVLLSGAFAPSSSYVAPSAGDSVDKAIANLTKGHSDNVTALAQKQAAITGAATTVTMNDLSPDRALVSSGSGKIAVSAVTATELGYVHGVTSGIQGQIDGVSALAAKGLKQEDLTTYTGTDGEIVQHRGTTTSDYTDGYVYKFTEGGDLPSNEFCIKLLGGITQYQQDVDVAAMIGNDRIFYNSDEHITFYNDSYASLYIGSNTSPAVGDSILGDNNNEALWEVEEVVSAVQPFKVRYRNSALFTQSFITTHNTWYKNSSGVKLYTMHGWNDETYKAHPATVNFAWFVEYQNKLYKITMADGAWLGSTDDVEDGGWQRVNVQPSSEGAVSDLESRMTAAETAISGKQATITGAASTITTANMTASKVLGSDANGKVAATSIATADAEDAVSKRHTQNTDTRLSYENYGVGRASVYVNGDEYFTYASMQADAEKTAYINVGVVGDSANITLAAGNNAISIDATTTSISNNVNIAGDLTLNNNVLTGSDLADVVEKKHTQNTDTQIVNGNNKVEVSASGTAITGNGSVSGNFSVSGNLNVTGKETVEEIVNIKSENNFITLRDGAQTAIASGSLSGTKVENYDGLGNDLLFGTDADGTFRIGDDGGTLEPIMTRAEAANLADGELLMWDATNQRAVRAQMPANKVITTDVNGRLNASGNIETNELATLNGVTGNIQTQLNSKAPSANLVNGAPLSNAASYFYGVSTSAANATQKEVSIPSITTLNAGQVIVVKPTVSSQLIPNATLKLNDFAAFQIKAQTGFYVDGETWNADFAIILVFDGSYWNTATKGVFKYPMSVQEGIAGTFTLQRTLSASILQQIIYGQIDKFVGTRAMTEDAYWDLVVAGTVQADTLYITYDNDWEG